MAQIVRVEVITYRDKQTQQYLGLDQLGRTPTLPERFPIRHIDTEVYPNALIGAITLHSRRPERVQIETLWEYGLMPERTMSSLAKVIKRLQTTHWEIIPEWRTIEIPLSVSSGKSVKSALSHGKGVVATPVHYALYTMLYGCSVRRRRGRLPSAIPPVSGADGWCPPAHRGSPPA